ncbi:NAD(P)/FAD-dependent oxidoreductase [Bradyrhizobium sp. Pear77]|uniref:dihydrolipoyl dehydrogenase family protein n=1 Tax=Bradyrhizobium altum TaxID=1571202 RepID=UPI001E5C43EE|nr:NAD(P)/FAD-dependent oxidoreductase [Bradyrhizobium altum]MCC8953207.1 NAD(P)/FAD-dependent oxidoreductase [Bradyrhizobium altum]
MTDVLVVGAGPAGVAATLRAADLGVRTTLVTSGEFGGMAANDGPVPVRTLAHAGRLLRDARQLSQYGITVNEPVLNYSTLLGRVREVVTEVRTKSSLRQQIDSSGVTVHENAGTARFVDSNTIETSAGLRLSADRIIICTGGASRRLPIPGFELTSTHSDAWALTSIPPSMIVVGAGATGVQVASIFNAFGSRVQLFEAGPRILVTEDADISSAAALALQHSGIAVHENFGAIDSFEKTSAGVRMTFTKGGHRFDAEATLVVVAVGWVAETSSLDVAAAGIELNERKFLKVDEYLRTSAPHVFAAGDITGHFMLVPQAIQAGWAAATNAVQGPTMPLVDQVSPMGSFTEPEYAQAGLTEAKAREAYDVVTSIVHFDVTTRTIIDGRTFGFCKLIADRKTCRVIGCHVIGERAVDIAEVAAIAIAAGMRVDDLAQLPLAYPTYGGILARAAVMTAGQLGLSVGWQAHRAEGVPLAKHR